MMYSSLKLFGSKNDKKYLSGAVPIIASQVEKGLICRSTILEKRDMLSIFLNHDHVLACFPMASLQSPNTHASRA